MDDVQEAFLAQLQDSLLPILLVLATVLVLARFRKAQPSGLTFALILVPLPLLAFSSLWPVLAQVASVYTPLLMVSLLVDGLWLSTSASQISLSRMITPTISIGQPAEIGLTIINNSAQPIQGWIRDSIPAGLQPPQDVDTLNLPVFVTPYGHQIVTYSLAPSRRGLYHFEQIHLKYRSAWGLLWLTHRGGRADSIRVTPDLRQVQRLRAMASRAQNPGELQKRALGLEGTQFNGLRHYLSGDDLKKMAWQATAKLDMPVIRSFTHEVEQPILVLLDAGRRMALPFQNQNGKKLDKYDWALNAALAFVAVAIDRGDQVGAGVFSNHLHTHIPLGRGRRHLSQIAETLGETQVQAVEPDYESMMLQAARKLKRRALVVIFTDLIDPVSAQSLLHSLHCFSSNHVLLIVTLTDSETEQWRQKSPQTTQAAYEKGVALDLINLRAKALHTLCKTHQAIVIDAPPDQLDETLIRQYLQLKAKNYL